MIRVLSLACYAFPERAASYYLSDTRNQAFANACFNTILYTPTPTRGLTPEERKMYKYKKLEIRYDGAMKIHRFAMFAEGKNPLIRAFRYLCICIKEFNRGVFFKDARTCNIMFISSTPPIQGAMAACVKKIRHIPLVYNLQDIFPDSLVGTGLAKKGGLLWKIGRVIENFTYRNADKIIVISEDFKRNIMAKGVPEEKIEVIYNWVDENAVKPVNDEDNPLFDEFDVSREKFRVVYAGNLGNAQNIQIIMDAATRLREHDNIQFIIFGKGGLESEIRKQIDEKNLTNIKQLPLQPYERVSYVYSLGNVDVVSCKSGLGGSAMPSKTWSIMSTGRPVLASFDEGELKDILEKNHCGVFTQANNIDEFVAAIENLAINRDLCRELGRNGRQFIMENLTKEVGTRKYVDVIRSFENKTKK